MPTARETTNVNVIIEVIVEDVVWTGPDLTKIQHLHPRCRLGQLYQSF